MRCRSASRSGRRRRRARQGEPGRREGLHKGDGGRLARAGDGARAVDVQAGGGRASSPHPGSIGSFLGMSGGVMECVQVRKSESDVSSHI